MGEIQITGSLRHTESGTSYTFSVKAFKTWKIQFLKAYFQSYQSQFKSDIPDSGEREALYKAVLKMNGVDIFGTNRSARKISEEMYTRATNVANLISTK